VLFAFVRIHVSTLNVRVSLEKGLVLHCFLFLRPFADLTPSTRWIVVTFIYIPGTPDISIEFSIDFYFLI